MNKKIIKNMILALSLSLIFSGCEFVDINKTSNQNSDLNINNELNEDELKDNEKIDKITNEEFKKIFDKNIDAMFHIYVLSELKHEDNNQEMIYEDVESCLRKITDSRFKTLKDLEDYTNTIYCKKETERLLYTPTFNDRKKYVERNGELYLDLGTCGGKGYYVDWSSYEIEIEEVKNNESNFKVIAKVEWPAENPVKEDYEVNGKIIYEDGKWVLDKMYS